MAGKLLRGALQAAADSCHIRQPLHLRLQGAGSAGALQRRAAAELCAATVSRSFSSLPLRCEPSARAFSSAAGPSPASSPSSKSSAAGLAAGVAVPASLPSPPPGVPAVNTAHPNNNVAPSIIAKMGKSLHLRKDHPLGQMKAVIQSYFESRGAAPPAAAAAAAAGQAASPHAFRVFDQLYPVVSTKQNFDDLLTPPEHVSRKSTDTYYVTDNHLLRCHMTAHQTELIRAGEKAFLMIGDVYRRDEIDATHYPVFHQVDGVRVWQPEDLPADIRGNPAAVTAYVVEDLKSHLEGMVRAIFGAVEMRWVEAYFPFTDPSLELEIQFEGKWLEVLGCGKIQQQILRNCGTPDAVGWAFGMGLERLAMVLYSIPDIRLFWSEDERFLGQFSGASAGGKPVKFKPFSKFPPCYKDITFWLPGSGAAPAASSSAAASSSSASYHENDFFALVREVAGDLVESVQLLDAFTHPKSKRSSHCYRIMYRDMSRSLTNAEIDELQRVVREKAVQELQVELR